MENLGFWDMQGRGASQYAFRIRLASVGFLFVVLVLVVRLFYWQVVKGQELSSRGYFQQQTASKVVAQRGDILARDGTWLAASLDAWRVYVERPQFADNPRDVAKKLALLFVEKATEGEARDADSQENPEERYKEALEKEEARIESLLSNDKLVWIPIKNRVSRKVREEIEKLGIPGVGFELEENRAYPEASSAAQLLGFVGKDDAGFDKGYFGLEGYYDESLAGKHGFKSGEASALGVPIIFGANKEGAAVRGVNLITHIDKVVQLALEKHLKMGLERYGAVSGSIIVARPKDGAILAMASLPSYEPSKYFDYGDDFFRNPVISDGFEPGSIFKPIVMAAGLDAGVIGPETVCDICGGPLKVDKYFIRTWNNEYSSGSSMRDVIVHSDNVGMAFVGGKLGADKLYDYLADFGLGSLTGIDLQGEVTPKLREKGTWGVVDLATASFGQGIAVTPIQMVKAISIIANRGREVTPQIVDKVELAGGMEDLPPAFGKQVISPKAAREITEMMVAAVKEGEAKWAVPKGYEIAGKTGTAQIPVAGHYDSEKTIASFVGFAPPEEPEFLMLITLREPKSSPWASETAAPLWFDIAKEVFPYLRIKPGA